MFLEAAHLRGSRLGYDSSYYAHIQKKNAVTIIKQEDMAQTEQASREADRLLTLQRCSGFPSGCREYKRCGLSEARRHRARWTNV